MKKVKKIVLFTAFAAVIAHLLTGCASLAAPSATSSSRSSAAIATGPDDLDDVIREASDYLDKSIPSGSYIVILNIQSDSTALSNYIIDELIANAVNDGNFSVVDRARLDEIRDEQNFQFSGEVADDLALAIGRFIGAQTIVSGTVSSLGSRYRMTIRALDVQTARVQGQFNKNISAGETIVALMQSSITGGSGITATASGGRTQSTAGNTGTTGGGQTAAPAQPAGPQAGTYTFFPRLRPTRAGLNVNDVFIPQITVTRDFIVIHFCKNATGAWEDGEWDSGISGFYDASYFTLQNLDNPSQFFSPVSQQSTNNGMGRIWTMSYRRFNATRLKLTGKQYGGDQQPFVFEEIDLSKAEYQP